MDEVGLVLEPVVDADAKTASSLLGKLTEL